MSAVSLREEALAIWQAGVDAVDSAQLVRNVIQQTETGLVIAGHEWDFTNDGRICVIGAGKAGAGMATGFESLLKDEWKSHVFGWINVPEDCVRELETIHLHGARPAGVNEPTAAGVEGVQEILECVRTLGEEDLCVVLISGGGSALLPAPVEGISLEDKQMLTRNLMHAGATIQELNTVRSSLSKIKGGGLLRACHAGRLISLIISDVIGDPLETIASGPTVDIASDPQRAIETLNTIAARSNFEIPSAILHALQGLETVDEAEASVSITYSNHVIGNNQTAVEAAAKKASELGYEIKLKEHDQPGDANATGKQFAEKILQEQAVSASSPKLCFISGGEPTVVLAVTEEDQKGGRNQELVLAAAKVLEENPQLGIVIVSGGTDGEDGPTDAAGAIIDLELLKKATELNLTIADYLSVNNSYSYFEQIDGLIKTGPTHTNVMDLRVGLLIQ
ncbi:DUF4147 domain-containing protein [bacterium]|nr:DUF4147 domain-containing protein [Planctomicrobium sp.]MDB4731322.1 DUF4147 domain-containing protein [bacterium]